MFFYFNLLFCSMYLSIHYTYCNLWLLLNLLLMIYLWHLRPFLCLRFIFYLLVSIVLCLVHLFDIIDQHTWVTTYYIINQLCSFNHQFYLSFPNLSYYHQVKLYYVSIYFNSFMPFSQFHLNVHSSSYLITLTFLSIQQFVLL